MRRVKESKYLGETELVWHESARWIHAPGYSYNDDLLRVGILVFRPIRLHSRPDGIGPHTFLLNNHEYRLDKKPLPKNQEALLLPLFRFSAGKLKSVAVSVGTSLPMCAKTPSGEGNKGEPGKKKDAPVLLSNVGRRDEVYCPVTVTAGVQEAAFYMHTWLNAPSKFNAEGFSGFKQYVTAGCMIGASLEAIDQHGHRLPFIQHHLPLHPSQIIKDFELDSFSAYKEVLFFQLQNFVQFIKATSESKPSVFFHLPYYDYLLFGIQLFVNEKVTYEALKEFNEIIKNQSEEYFKEINALFSIADIDVEIGSPFNPIFDNLIFSNTKNLTDGLFEILGLTADDKKHPLPSIAPWICAMRASSSPQWTPICSLLVSIT